MDESVFNPTPFLAAIATENGGFVRVQMSTLQSLQGVALAIDADEDGFTIRVVDEDDMPDE